MHPHILRNLQEKTTQMRVGNAKDFFRACQIVGIAGIVLIIGLYIFGQWDLNTPEADFTITPLSLSAFYNRSSHSGLPATATNLYYASAHRGFVGFVDMYRFDAPAADCIAYGKRLLQQGNAQDIGLVALTASPDPFGKSSFDAMGLSKVNWFDVETIKSGLEGHREPSPSGQPGMTLWIDTDRGRFYFSSSD